MASIQPSYDPRWKDPPPGFGWTSSAQGPGVSRVRLSGEFDIAAAPCLGDALSEAADRSVAVILDLSEVTFIDSTGLHAIVRAHTQLANAGCRLVILRGARQVHRTFQLTGVDRVLEFVSTREVGDLVVAPSR